MSVDNQPWHGVSWYLVALGVWWYVWGAKGFWWGIWYAMFWKFWFGYRMAEWWMR